MPISKSENLFLLIQSLSKSEKRSFKLYAGRNSDGKHLLYIKLFEFLDKANDADDTTLKIKLGGLSNAAYSNLKKHLYEQLMISLRLIQKEKKQNFKIREQVDFAYILYGKGLHMQALEVLGKAKAISQKHYNDFSLLTIIELEKLIQSRHITRSKSEPIDKLIKESSELVDKVSDRITLSNIRLRLHKFYIEQGHIESREKEIELRDTFSANMEKINESNLEGIERIYYFQSFVWFYYILDQFDQCLIWSQKWVDAFMDSKELQRRDVDLYMRGYHYLLTSAFNIKKIELFERKLQELEKFRHDNYSKLNHNSQIVSFQYVHNGRMNLHFLKGTFDKGIKNIPSTISRIKRYSAKLDYHKVMVIYYKVAWMYIGAGTSEKSIKYLDFIIDLTDKSLREDIQCYARIMKLIALYEMEEYNKIIHYIKDYQRFFDKMKYCNKVQLTAFELLGNLASVPLFDRREILKRNYQKLELLRSNNFEHRAFIYLDILPWIQSKLEKRSLAEVIKNL